VGLATDEVFSEGELAQLRGFPEINRTDLIRHFTLTSTDEAFLRRFRTNRNVLGAAVQLCTLTWLGFVPDDVTVVPADAVGRLSQRLGIPVGELRGYGGREQTRPDHLREVAGYAGWRAMDVGEWKELEDVLATVSLTARAALVILAIRHRTTLSTFRPSLPHPTVEGCGARLGSSPSTG
jgi:hypothetical protein